METTLSLECVEPEGTFVRSVQPLIFTPENAHKFYKAAAQFPTLYGKEIIGGPEEFINLFLSEVEGVLQLNGLFWVVDDFVGVFYLTDIRPAEDALVHYSFFDRRHRGRVPLVRAMLRHLFEKYKFQRLTAEIPNYTGRNAKHFATEVGFVYEGKKRQAARYKNSWFDVNVFGLLHTEV